jgi:replicative DNA helicase
VARAERYDLQSQYIEPELERRLLAACAAEPEVLRTCAGRLTPDAFPAEQEAWLALAAAAQTGAGIEPLPWTPSAEPLEDAARLADLLARRHVAALLETGAGALHGEKPGAEVLADLERLAGAARLALQVDRAGCLQWGTDLLAGVLETARERRAERERTGRSILGIPTGFPALDNALNGWMPGLHLLAGAPGMGKTSLALQVALHACKQPDTSAVYVSFENSLQNLAEKALAAQARTSSQHIARGMADLAALQAAGAALRPALARLALLEGTPGLTVGTIRGAALEARRRHGGRVLVVLDYLQTAARGRGQELRLAVGDLLLELRGLANSLEVPVLALASQNRAAGQYGNGGGSAALDSLKESGDAEYSCDTALFLKPGEKRTVSAGARAVDLVISKNRNGPSGLSVPLVFRPDHGIFREEDPRR